VEELADDTGQDDTRLRIAELLGHLLEEGLRQEHGGILFAFG